ncbi:MAG: hypothetical protein WCL06_01360 [Bacteroidota bacterium]
MKKLFLISGIIAIFFSACGQNNKPTHDILVKKNVTITGIANDAKLGAVIETDSSIYYVDGLDYWPKDKYDKKITVIADLYKTSGPVFIQQKNSPAKQGIPVKDSNEYEKHKYLLTLKNINYKK